MANYYGYRLKFYCTSSGPRAVFQGKTIDGLWEDISEEYAPDSSADPESVGATVSASGILLPTGSMIASKPSEAQYWFWLLDGSGNIPITIDPTTKGVVTVSTEISSWSGHDDGKIGFWFGDAAPTAGAGGLGFFIRQTSSPNFNAERAYNDGSSLLFIATNPDLKYADMVMNYCDSVVEETIISVYDSSLTFVDSTTTPTDLGIATPAFALLAGHGSTAAVAVTVNPIAYLYWPGLGPEISETSPGPANEIVLNYYNALIIQDERFITDNIVAGSSDYTQSDRKPGFATPVSDTDMLCVASGAQDEIDYDIYISKPGFPDEAAFLYRESGESTYGYIGQERQTIAHRCVNIDASVTYQVYHTSSVTTKSGRVVVAYSTTSDPMIKTAYYDNGNFEGLQTIVSDGDYFYLELTESSIGTTYANCNLLYDEDHDEILLFVMALYEGNNSLRYMQLWTYSSKDDGVTFNIKAKNIIKSESVFYGEYAGLWFKNTRYDRMGSIRVGDAIMFFITSYYDNTIDDPSQYIYTLVSYDYGVTMTVLEQENLAEVNDISCAGNMVVYRRNSDPGTEAFRYKIFNSVKPWSNVDYNEVSNYFTLGTDFALMKKRDGSYTLAYGYNGEIGDYDSTTTKWARDIALIENFTRDDQKQVINAILSTGDATIALKRLSIAESKGDLILFFQKDGVSYLTDKYCVFLGGNSNVCLPDYAYSYGSFYSTFAYHFQLAYGLNTDGGNYDSFTTYPFDDVPSSIWTASGTDTLSIAAYHGERIYRIDASGSSPGLYYTHAIDTSGASLTVDFQLGRCTSSLAAAGSRGCGVEIDFDNGTTTMINLFLEAYFDGSDYKYALKNLGASTTLYTGDYGGSYCLKFRLIYRGTKIRLFVSDSTNDNYNSVTNWVLAYSSDSVTKGTSTSARFNLAWGIYSASSSDYFYLSFINFFSYSGDEWDLTDASSINGDSTDYRHGIPATSRSSLITGGLLLKWQGGPAIIGDAYTLTPSYTHPIDNIDALKITSKSLVYFNDDDANDVKVVYSPESNAPVTFPNTNLGWYIEKPNFKLAYLQARASLALSWTTLITLNTCEGFEDLAYTCTISIGSDYGPGLKPDSSSEAGSRPIQHGELIGGYVICDNGSSTAVFKIRYNTEGVWGGSSVTSKKPTIYVDDWDTAFGTGTLSIIWPSNIAILPEFTTEYIQYRLYIPAQTTQEGKIGLGKSVIGPAYLFAREASFGRTVTNTQNISMKQTQSGQRFARKLGPSRKKIGFAWAEYAGDDLQLLENTDPDYVSLTEGGEPVSFRESLPYLFEGLHDQLLGGVRTAILCLSLPSGVSPISSNDRKTMLRGRILNEYQRNANLGIENISEYWTINTIEIEEEL